ncbi:hypothetical protein GW17_00050946 [Ensete ventricosum]|nr:hypothetical protein GW17_00050946 [Ensete ventricosum]
MGPVPVPTICRYTGMDRYNLMANRVLLLVTLSSRSDSHLSSKILGQTAVLKALQNTLDDFSSAKERSKQCVAAEVMAVTGKGKYGTRIPLLRQRILDCLIVPLPQTMATNIVSKRYAFLSVALAEISPPRMPIAEVHYHHQLLEELLDNMSHSSAQV